MNLTIYQVDDMNRGENKLFQVTLETIFDCIYLI